MRLYSLKLAGLPVSVGREMRPLEEVVSLLAENLKHLHKLLRADFVELVVQVFHLLSRQAEIDDVHRNRVDEFRDHRLALAERGIMQAQR